MSATKHHHHDTIEAATRQPGKEYPILFTGPMVTAIQSGKKTQTRRLNGLSKINENPDDWTIYDIEKDPFIITSIDKYGNDIVKKISGTFAHFENNHFFASYRSIRCPYGSPGDRLWVRETWAKQLDGKYIYRSDFEKWELADYTATGAWRPSIHMPRAASRLLLEITDIGVQRLQDITESDAVAEGCASGGDWDTAPTIIFSKLWDTINGPGAWIKNPWVWVVSFKKL